MQGRLPRKSWCSAHEPPTPPPPLRRTEWSPDQRHWLDNWDSIHGVARFCDHTDEGRQFAFALPPAAQVQYVPSGSSLQPSNNGNIPM